MTQTIQCQSCEARTVAETIADLINTHTNAAGRFPCAQCGATDTFLRPRGGRSKRSGAARWVRGVLPIETRSADAAVRPFVFLTADGPDGEVTGIEFKYYRSVRLSGRPAKSKAAVEGGPVLAPAQLLALAGRLAKIGVVSPDDWRALTKTVNSPKRNRS